MKYLHMNISYCIFIVFSPHNTCINLPNISLVFLANYAMPPYGCWNVHYCINWYIYMVFQIRSCSYVNVACVMFIMWFWHNTNVGIAFWNQGSTQGQHGSTNVTFGMTHDVGITYWVISKTCNAYLVFQFIIVLNVGITYWVMNIAS
jgi:hypothetical protein